jgi:hypothetical protein
METARAGVLNRRSGVRLRISRYPGLICRVKRMSAVDHERDAIPSMSGCYGLSCAQGLCGGRITRRIPVGSPNHAITCGIAETHDAVWVSVGDANCDINGQ